MKESGFGGKEIKDGKVQLEALLGIPPKEVEERERWMKENKAKIREIIESGFVGDQKDKDAKRAWLFEALFSYYNFQDLEFNTGSVSCTGSDLLIFLGLPVARGKEGGKEQFYEFTSKIFPEESEALSWMDEKFPSHMASKERRLKLLSGEANEKDSQGATDEDIAELLGYNKQQVQRDGVLPRSIEKALGRLSQIEKLVVEEHILKDKDFAEIGKNKDVNLSEFRVREFFYTALRKIRKILESLKPEKLTGETAAIYTAGDAIDESVKSRTVSSIAEEERLILVWEKEYRKFLTDLGPRDMRSVNDKTQKAKLVALYDAIKSQVEHAVNTIRNSDPINNGPKLGEELYPIRQNIERLLAWYKEEKEAVE